MKSLEEEFHETMINIYKSAAKDCNYKPLAFLKMVVEIGGVQAAKKLLSTGIIQSGLYRLYECGRLDLTVEHLVCQEKYCELFEPKELAEAKRRLDMFKSR